MLDPLAVISPNERCTYATCSSGRGSLDLHRLGTRQIYIPVEKEGGVRRPIGSKYASYRKLFPFFHDKDAPDRMPSTLIEHVTIGPHSPRPLTIPRILTGLWQLAGGHDAEVDVQSAAEEMSTLVDRGLTGFDMADRAWFSVLHSRLPSI